MGKLKALFEPQYTLTIHLIQLCLIILVFILAIVRVALNEMPITRATIMFIPISIKSLIIISYQLLTEHKERFRKWASLKANMILSIIEVLFWAVLMGLGFSAVSTMCIGASCGVSVVLALLALVLMFIGMQVAVVSVLNWRHFRRYHYKRGSMAPLQRDYENAHRFDGGSHH